MSGIIKPLPMKMKRSVTFPLKSITFSIIIVLTFIYLYIYANGLSLKKGETYVKQLTPTSEPTQVPPTPTVTNFPTPTPTTIPSPTTKPSDTPTPTIDPNPIVKCSINDKCGGGTELLLKNVCNLSTCCQVGNNWIFYLDKNKCLHDQNTYYQSLTPTITPTPTLTPTPTPDPYCTTVQNNWKQVEQNLMNPQIYYYVNSSQELQTLYFYLQAFQKQADSHKCNIKLSL